MHHINILENNSFILIKCVSYSLQGTPLCRKHWKQMLIYEEASLRHLHLIRIEGHCGLVPLNSFVLNMHRAVSTLESVSKVPRRVY